MNGRPSIRLRTDRLELQVNPSIGGAIRDFYEVRDGLRRPLLRESHSDAVSVLDMACFPLVPYVNRIRGGQFTFRDRVVTIAPNMAGDISPLHGQGWLGAWTPGQQDERSATLTFDHPAGEWPWAYQASLHYALDDDGLDAQIACTNRSDQPMPCGLGFHPYFPCTAQTILDTEVTSAWEIDEHVLPTREVPAVGRFDLKQRHVCGQGLDHGFGGWGGSATISDPKIPRLNMSSPDARFFQLYSPTDGGIFVAEPVSHANAALNAPEAEWVTLGMRVLDPGETMTLRMRIALDPLG